MRYNSEQITSVSILCENSNRDSYKATKIGILFTTIHLMFTVHTTCRKIAPGVKSWFYFTKLLLQHSIAHTMCLSIKSASY